MAKDSDQKILIWPAGSYEHAHYVKFFNELKERMTERTDIFEQVEDWCTIIILFILNRHKINGISIERLGSEIWPFVRNKYSWLSTEDHEVYFKLALDRFFFMDSCCRLFSAIRKTDAEKRVVEQSDNKIVRLSSLKRQ